MHHYPHHIGDFNSATRHLTRIERSVYRDLIELYYDTEEPLTLDMSALCRKIIARSNEEVTAVEQTLNEFFIETECGWFHSRCDEVIRAFYESKTQKSEAGKASAAAKAARKAQAKNGKASGDEQTINDRSTTVQQPLISAEVPLQQNSTNQDPESINHISVLRTDAEASAMTAKDAIWSIGIPWMADRGSDEEKVRRMVGKVIKQLGEDEAWSLVQDCMREQAVEPVAWLAGALNKRMTVAKGAAATSGATGSAAKSRFDLSGMDYTPRTDGLPF